MIAAVALKLQALQLDQARESLATVQQAPASPADPAAQAGAILELSAAAQALLSTPPA